MMMPAGESHKHSELGYRHLDEVVRMPTPAVGGHGAVGEWPRRPASLEPYLSGGSTVIRGATGGSREERWGSGGSGTLDIDHLLSGLRLSLEDSWSPVIARPASTSPCSFNTTTTTTCSTTTTTANTSSSLLHAASTATGSASPLGPAFAGLPSAISRLRSSMSLGEGSEEDLSFKNDLAHVLVWFGEDLSSEQKLTTVYTLIRRLPKPQLDLLLECIKSDGDYSTPMHHATPHARFGGGSWRRAPEQKASTLTLAPRPVRASPFTLSPPESVVPSRPTSPSSSSPSSSAGVSPIELVQVNLSLFEEDYPAWLRHHRLHKYQDNFRTLWEDRQAILRLSDADLERIGISALGARRKFLRLFETVVAAMAARA